MEDKNTKAKIEEKRRTLALLREEKERRRNEREARISDNSHSISKIDTDELLKSLGILNSKTDSFTSSEGSMPSINNCDSIIKTPIKNKRRPLVVTKFFHANIPPKENVTYNKQTQTLQSSFDKEETGYFNIGSNLEWDDEFNLEDSLPSSIEPTPSVFGNASDSTSSPKEKFREHINLSEEDKNKILLSSDFLKFVKSATNLVEKAFEDEVDIFVDYTGHLEECDKEDNKGIELSLCNCFIDYHWSKNRTITSFDWSSLYPEWLVASYNNNEESPQEPDGVCLIWNIKFKKNTPEYVFHCQSAVMSSCFAKFHPNLVIGGTYSGQLVVWDNRVNKQTPVQRSPLSASAHTHPVYCVQVVGTQNAHNLVTISTDGKLCTWSLDMLSAPQDSIELLQQKQSRSVAATCLSFPPDDNTNFLIGSEEGSVYFGSRQGSQSGIVKVFDGHQGPITSVSNHPSPDFSHLFLSSSLDWTVKLWSLKESKPLLSFEDNSDYMYDVAWSPIHPALFTCVDGTGRVDLWNLNLDTELPTVSLNIDGNPALNRVVWTPSGHQVLVGDDMGKIWMYDVGEQLVESSPDEWVRFQQTLDHMANDLSDSNIPIS